MRFLNVPGGENWARTGLSGYPTCWVTCKRYDVEGKVSISKKGWLVEVGVYSNVRMVCVCEDGDVNAPGNR